MRKLVVQSVNTAVPSEVTFLLNYCNLINVTHIVGQKFTGTSVQIAAFINLAKTSYGITSVGVMDTDYNKLLAAITYNATQPNDSTRYTEFCYDSGFWGGMEVEFSPNYFPSPNTNTAIYYTSIQKGAYITSSIVNLAIPFPPTFPYTWCGSQWDFSNVNFNLSYNWYQLPSYYGVKQTTNPFSIQPCLFIPTPFRMKDIRDIYGFTYQCYYQDVPPNPQPPNAYTSTVIIPSFGGFITNLQTIKSAISATGIKNSWVISTTLNQTKLGVSWGVSDATQIIQNADELLLYNFTVAPNPSDPLFKPMIAPLAQAAQNLNKNVNVWPYLSGQNASMSFYMHSYGLANTPSSVEQSWNRGYARISAPYKSRLQIQGFSYLDYNALATPPQVTL